jgi:uncharacterized protein
MEGNSKPIEQIQVGEMVLARNEFEPNGPLELKRVEELFTRTSPIIELEIGGQKIGTTDEHPFYVPAREAFVPARELQVGDQLISHNGQLLRIDAIHSTLQIATVYNLRVADYHTYFVGCDEWGWSVWAHNACKVDTADVEAYMKQLATGKKVDWNSINPNLSKTQQSAVRGAAREKGAEIFTPNPGGKLGDAVTRRTASTMKNQLKNRGFEDVQKEVSFQTPNSTHGKVNRIADVFAIDDNAKKAVLVQVVRTTKSNKLKPHRREFDAKNDMINSPEYQRLLREGYDIQFLMVRRGANSLSNPVRTY